MLESNHLPETIRIKYCLKGDKHFRLYNCSKEELNFLKISQLLVENYQKFSVKMYISSNKIQGEVLVKSEEDFRQFFFSPTFFNYYDSKYNCIKIQFTKESLINNEALNKTILYKQLITDKNVSLTFDYIVSQFLKDNIGQKELITFLENKGILKTIIDPRNSGKLIEGLLQNIKENYDGFIGSKAMLGSLDLEVNMQSLEEIHSDNQEILNFSSVYNINEMNLVSNEELIRDSSVFRTKKFPVLN
jgi:hypothetical protein